MSEEAHHRRLAISYITKQVLACARTGVQTYRSTFGSASTQLFSADLDEALHGYDDDTFGWPRDRHGERVAPAVGVRLHPRKGPR